MDKNLRNFFRVALSAIAILILTSIVFSAFYFYQSLIAYNYILLTLLIMTILITLLFITAVVAVLHAYRHKYVNRGLLWLTRISVRFLLPLMQAISWLAKENKDAIRSFYIDVNNILVESEGSRYLPADVLILLPHCLQNSNCVYKVTNNISNCRRCGKCCIGELASIGERLGVKVSVVTGGTAARNTILQENPKLVFSVACERDLSSGISDIRRVPVLGMINERPNGPCNNTVVDALELERKLKSILKLDVGH